jgi:hypothetical protein
VAVVVTIVGAAATTGTAAAIHTAVITGIVAAAAATDMVVGAMAAEVTAIETSRRYQSLGEQSRLDQSH